MASIPGFSFAVSSSDAMVDEWLSKSHTEWLRLEVTSTMVKSNPFPRAEAVYCVCEARFGSGVTTEVTSVRSR